MFQILIVEDDKELSQLFQKVLEKNGYQVKSASDGAEALEVLVKEYIDLIISDIMMPVMDGYELVSELRSAGYQIHDDIRNDLHIHPQPVQTDKAGRNRQHRSRSKAGQLAER